jgi:hypothetical protein
MRVTVAAGLAAAIAALAGCSGSGLAAPAPGASSRPADAASRAPGSASSSAASLTPGPAGIPPLIGRTAADRTVCLRFVRAGSSKAAADDFVAWVSSGPGRQAASHSARVLVRDIKAWYDDSYLSSGHPGRAGTDWAKASKDCRSIGIFGPG